MKDSPKIITVNLGDSLHPKWRLKIDGVVVAGFMSKKGLRPLRRELKEDTRKALAVRDAVLEIEALKKKKRDAGGG